MTNPFNDSPHGRDGTDPEFGTITTQGFHSLSAADVDGDGKQEIVYGAATIDDDGSLLYSSFDVLPPRQRRARRAVARLGHGDAMHVTDIDPDRPGLEIYTVHEGGDLRAVRARHARRRAPARCSSAPTPAGTPAAAWSATSCPTYPGMEAWASCPAASGARLDRRRPADSATPSPAPTRASAGRPT